MPKTSIHPPGEKLQKAVKAFDEMLQEKPGMKRLHILQKIAMRFDLSPKECDFLERHFADE